MIFVYLGLAGICSFPYLMLASVFSKLRWFVLWFCLSMLSLAFIFIGASLENQ